MKTTPEFIQWLSNGERGLSSNFMATVLSGIECRPPGWQYLHHPHDIWDFLRCEKLLVAVPEYRARLQEMAVYPVWDEIVPEWDTIVSKYEEEKENNYFPISNFLIQKAIARSETKEEQK